MDPQMMTYFFLLRLMEGVEFRKTLSFFGKKKQNKVIVYFPKPDPTMRGKDRYFIL
jgi:hypothetical protein